MNEGSYGLSHQSLEPRRRMKFLSVMVREQVLEGGLMIDSMRDFKRSISTCSSSIPSLIEEDEGVLLGFSKSKVA